MTVPLMWEHKKERYKLNGICVTFAVAFATLVADALFSFVQCNLGAGTFLTFWRLRKKCSWIVVLCSLSQFPSTGCDQQVLYGHPRVCDICHSITPHLFLHIHVSSALSLQEESGTSEVFGFFSVVRFALFLAFCPIFVCNAFSKRPNSVTSANAASTKRNELECENLLLVNQITISFSMKY